MARHKSFVTAAARRALNPIVWDIDGTVVRLRPMVDFAELGVLADRLMNGVSEGTGSPLKDLVDRRAAMVDLVSLCILENDRPLFKDVSQNLDIPVLVEMVEEVIGEYSGAANPTKGPSSSAGSSPTGESSTAGALAGGSTPPLSPPIVPATSISSL
jgi:hypothetical protein